MLRKGSSYIKMVESNPNLAFLARETYYGKRISDNPSYQSQFESFSKIGDASLDNRPFKAKGSVTIDSSF